MTNKHPFIKEVVNLNRKPPSIVCYTDDQLQHLKTVCADECGSVLGVDRTFNLGACYVTCTVFQDHKLVRKSRGVILGPVYLHWDGEFITYQRFFSHLSAVLNMSVSDTMLSTNNWV